MSISHPVDLSEGLAFFWGTSYDTEGRIVSPRIQRFFANRAKTLLHHPQALGNYFSYRHAIPILGIDAREVFADGKLTLPDRYADFGYMYSQIGPPESALRAMRDRVTAHDVGPYPPDLLHSLRDLVAQSKFGRQRSERFDVIGTEGAQGGIGYTFLAFVNPEDEVIVADPSYMHFASGPLAASGVVTTIPTGPHNGFRLDPAEVKARITTRTKMIVVCDPLNPFGTVQTQDELKALAELAERNNILIFNNTTHGTHRTDPHAQHFPMASLHDMVNVDNVISCTGVSKGYGLAGIRIGFLGGHPDLLKAVALLKREVTKIHNNILGQYGCLAALQDEAYVEEATRIIRRNLEHIKATVAACDGVTIPVEPQYGFCMCLDTSATGVTAQELTVALFKQGVCVIPGDALGDVGATRYIRLNYSHRDQTRLEQLRDALPKAIADARTGRYADGVVAFYKQIGTERGAKIIEEIRSRGHLWAR